MVRNFLLALSFLTRLPIGKWDFSGISLSKSAWAFPVVGAVVGLCGGAAYMALVALKLSPIIAAWLAVAFQILLTGGLHEDGLADTADGLASGRTMVQKLAIMRDSNIGSYGVLTLIIIVSLRASAVASFSGANFWGWMQVIGFFIAAGACSRTLIVLLMRSSANARSDGLSAMAGRPSGKQTIAALFIGLFSLLLAQSILVFFVSVVILGVCFFVIRSAIHKNFGGITGDTLGAMQQISEVALLVIM